METRNRGDFFSKDVTCIWAIINFSWQRGGLHAPLEPPFPVLPLWNQSAMVKFTGNDGWNSPGDKKGFQPQ